MGVTFAVAPEAGNREDPMKSLRVCAALQICCVMTMLIVPSAQGQTFKILHSFTGETDGAFPYAGLVQDSEGNFYGTTLSGEGKSGLGTVFELSKTGKETVLYTFTGGADGAFPNGGVIRDAEGSLYGTTTFGGDTTCNSRGCGVVFKLSATGTETVLHTFTGGTDGEYPYAGVIRDSDGNLYGTTKDGGATHGTVFKVSSSGEETILHSFTGLPDGGFPYGGLIQDAKGNLYGTTSLGGAYSSGTVFELNTAGEESVLFSFSGAADGGNPWAGVIRDAAGNLYGTAEGGASGNGVVFKLSPAGKETVLYNFKGRPDGRDPKGGLIRDAEGNLYGTTFIGGAYTRGTVFKLSAAGKETVLHSFCKQSGCPDGQEIWSGLIQDAKGNLYGTAYFGGASGVGSVFELTH
jgi:uncharacterized repeat protein (TIGR03803 family)